jgi:hypothetical protein
VQRLDGLTVVDLQFFQRTWEAVGQRLKGITLADPQFRQRAWKAGQRPDDRTTSDM